MWSLSKRNLKNELEQLDITELWEFNKTEHPKVRVADKVYGRKYGDGLVRVNIQENPYTHRTSVSVDLFDNAGKLVQLQERIYLYALIFLKYFGRAMTNIEVDYNQNGYKKFNPEWQKIEKTIKTIGKESLVQLTLVNNYGDAFSTLTGSSRSLINLNRLTIRNCVLTKSLALATNVFQNAKQFCLDRTDT